MSLEDRSRGFYISALGIAAMVIGSFGPWAKIAVLGASVCGVDGSNDGWGILVLALIAGVTLMGGRWLGVAVASVIALAISYYDRTHVQHVAGKASVLLTVGWGLNLVLAGAVAMLVGSLMLRSEADYDEKEDAATLHG